MAGAELLTVGEPDPSFAVDTDLGVCGARRLLVKEILVAAVRRLRRCNVGSGEIGDGAHQLSIDQTNDADRPTGIEWLAVPGVEGPVVFSPEFGAFLVGDPKAAGRVVGDGWTGFELGRRNNPVRHRALYPRFVQVNALEREIVVPVFHPIERNSDTPVGAGGDRHDPARRLVV